MCWKKEYKCYKGKESEECCQNRVDEAVAQVSFASTITSIVLSAIAIWMSITGERSTNEIKTRIMDVLVENKTTLNESDAINYFSSIREYFHGPNGRYLADRVIEYALDSNKLDAEFHRYMQECMEKTKDSKISKSEMELVYMGMAVCLTSLTYSEKTKKKIREMTKETQR